MRCRDLPLPGLDPTGAFADEEDGGVAFDVGVQVWKARTHEDEGTQFFARDSGWPVAHWVTVDHHLAHAALGFYDSPFARALVFSYDGAGNDGCFAAYHGARGDDGSRGGV